MIPEKPWRTVNYPNISVTIQKDENDKKWVIRDERLAVCSSGPDLMHAIADYIVEVVKWIDMCEENGQHSIVTLLIPYPDGEITKIILELQE
jgi:hypothetical protein